MKQPLPFCPGCGHSQFLKLLESALPPDSIAVHSLGCTTILPDHWPGEIVTAPPGMAAAVAAGIKRSQSRKPVFCYIGDGDLAGSGFQSLLHAALRQEDISVFCMNNLVTAGSGGQMSPTSLIGQITSSTRLGRSRARQGFPLKLAEEAADWPHIALSQRVSLHSVKAIKKARQAIQNAFSYQENGQGLSFIEVIGACPPYWHLSPVEASEYIEDTVLDYFKPQVYKSQPILR